MAHQQNSHANGSALAVARGLGWFSIGLGVVEVMAPRALTRYLGMWGREPLLRFYGMREIAAGVGILMSNNPAPWMWGRVAGDVLDLATFAAGLDQHNPRRGNVAMALAAVAGITAIDGVCARALSGKWQRGPVRDYSDRRGFPKSPEAMRGAARGAHTPEDMRTPEPLQPFTSRRMAEERTI